MLFRTVPPIPVSEKDFALRFEVHARPGAKRSAFKGIRGDAVEVAIGAPPVDGAANEELVRFLARELGVPRKNVEIVRGQTSKTKLVSVTGLDRETLHARLTVVSSSGK
ncbi:MAG: YggU family protein [Labilithrix sp.]|nr:YggU family protein [Labilithrix sp.]MCW5810678.1 YggU family protein [Labilithrix sp.]